MKKFLFGASLLLAAVPLLADVSLTDQRELARIAKQGDKKHHATSNSGRVSTNGTGDLTLVDASGLEYFINTNVAVVTSSASAAASEASYTAAVAGTDAGVPGTYSMTDGYDGYNALCIGVNGALTHCTTDDANFDVYTNNGAPTLECNNRQARFGTQNFTIAGQQLSVYRTVYVPTSDTFIRWSNVFTNNGTLPITFSAVTSNNLGSDSNTTILSSSSGDAVATTADTWVTTGQKSSATCCSGDPRLAHVLQGTTATTPLATNNFTNGVDRPWWGYTVTLQPGETKTIVNFGSGQPTIAAANAVAARLVTLTPQTTQCMAANELATITNFAAVAPTAPVNSPWMLGILVAGLVVAGILIARR